MRTQSSWSRLGSNNRNNHGNAHASAISAEIAYAGQTLTARKRDGVDNTPETWTVVCMPQTPEPGDLKVLIEGGANVKEASPVGFFFDNQQRLEETMELSFDGYWYELGKVYPTMFQGVGILRYCVGVRHEAL